MSESAKPESALWPKPATFEDTVRVLDYQLSKVEAARGSQGDPDEEARLRAKRIDLTLREVLKELVLLRKGGARP